MFDIAPDNALPRLRPDIQLNEAPPEPEGAPTWTLYDPAANKYYKIGWLEFECFTRFNSCKTINELLHRVSRETTLDPTIDDIRSIIIFLSHHNLVQASGTNAVDYFENERNKHEKEWWEKIFHSYLFFTLPLFKPQAFLNKTYPYVSFMFSKPFAVGSLGLLLCGIFVSLQRIDELSTTFIKYLNFEGVILFLLATIVVKIVHELGHAYAATKYDVPVTVMGIALIVMYPVLYSETTNAWKMDNRRERLNISMAGVMAEVALASIALLLWHVLSPGPLQSLCFMIAVVSMAASLLINLNPLMRFDGYYLFSDLVGVDNLQDRSFGFAKWNLRRWLWNWADEPPESLPRNRQNFLIIFGYAVWIYRFFLFFGIALLVYHVFFQPLGLLLMLLELIFFIGLPIFREIMVWWRRLPDIASTKRGKLIGALFLLFVLSGFVPLYGNVEIPAVMHAGNYEKLYAPIPARMDEILVISGQQVKAGQVLFRLSSPQLDYSISNVSQRLKALEGIRDKSQATLELAQKRFTIDQEIEGARKEMDGYIVLRDQLQIRTPYSGYVKDIDPSLSIGQSVDAHHQLALIVDESKYVVSGYIRESDMERVAMGVTGSFYPEFSPFHRYPVVLKRIEQTSLSEIFWPELSSLNNGPVPSERRSDGVIKTLPRYTFYAVAFDSPVQKDKMSMPDFVARGTILVDAAPRSLASFLLRKINSFFMLDHAN